MPREPEQQTTRQVMHLPARAGFEITVIEGNDTAQRATLDAGKILIGSGPLCDLRLTDQMVSRRHLALELTELGLLVTDLGSMNGTFVNETRVMVAYLTADDRLRLGSTVLQISARDVAERSPRAARSFGRLASNSARMLNVFTLCERLAPTDVPIILEGETGTGKEIVAECIHEASPRAAAPFVVLDCRTTPRELVEGHLFGEVSRADGSVRTGIFEHANGGTLLLDEPGDLDNDVQTKLLRALDKGIIVRVGDHSPTRVNARILVATSNDLDKMVEEGKFREDLYYRLAGARIELPPLRRRREDIPLLASEIWTELGGKGLLPDEFLERFEDYDWPGNVRELERAIERFLALGDKVSLIVNRTHRHVARPELPPSRTGNAGDDVLSRVLGANLGYSEARQRMLEEFERAYLEKALADNGGNVAAAAASSGIARRYFQRIRARQK